jgi:hypothetical protein
MIPDFLQRFLPQPPAPAPTPASAPVGGPAPTPAPPQGPTPEQVLSGFLGAQAPAPGPAPATVPDHLDFDIPALTEALSKTDMLSSITPEELANAQQDPVALKTLLNRATQTSLITAIQAISSKAKLSLDARVKAVEDSTASRITQQLNTNRITDIVNAVPEFKGELLAPMREAIIAKAIQQVPNASTADLQTFMQNYIAKAFRESVAPTPKPTPRQLAGLTAGEQLGATF